MLMKFTLLSLCSIILTAQLQAAVSLPVGGTEALSGEADSPAKEALTAFREGRHAKAIELAKPLAEKGNADALYLMGYGYETGQGLEASRELALENYRKAAATGHKDSIYRLSFILLASEDETERSQAREALEKASKDDPAVAGRILGEAYLRGRLSKEADFDKTVFWWNQAATAGDVPSLLLLARLYEGQFGFADKKDAKTALGFYSKAAGLGDAPSMVALGSRLLNGDKDNRNEKDGREWLKKAIEAKEYSAYLALGDFEENVKKDPKAALALYERGKDAGQVDCILRAADAYTEGKGTDKDPSRGTSLLESAAKAGSPMAHYRLAVKGLSADKPDMLLGYGHLLSAATGGLLEAQNELGLLYLSGKLAAADAPAGVAWLTRAAQGGMALAQNNLGALFEQGAGVPQNMANAGQLYSLAANQGHAGATLALARLYSKGSGVAADLPKAWALATLAAERGEETAKKFAGDLVDKFDDKQRAAGVKALEAIKSGKPTEPKPDATKPAKAADTKPASATTKPVKAPK
ncbi:MAG: tetratricopeptide repeat protein [Verrucomicrobiota bacterium]